MFEYTRGGLIATEIYRGAKLGIFDQLGKYDDPKTFLEIADDFRF